MPPKPKYTKEEIVSAAFSLVREKGEEALTARELAQRLCTSPRPIFTAFENMDALRGEVIKRCEQTYDSFIEQERQSGLYPEYKAMGMAYIRLARQEKNIFRLLFMRDTSGERPSDASFIRATDLISDMLSLDSDRAKKLHFEVWVWVHGIASMLATSYLDIDFETVSSMLTDVYISLRERIVNERDNKN